MAEATDRPQSPAQVPPDAVTSGEERGGPAPLSTETYQPLSLLAMAGFGLAVVYSLVVLFGGAVALFGRVPWLMPGWTFLLPIAILVLCWAARTRIHDSEGTLSGMALTTWGSRLAILFGLTYAAYYGFTFFAVRLQAIKFADSFFEQLKQGHSDQAFLMAQGMSAGNMSSGELRDMLESRFNQPAAMPATSGFLTRFRQERFVRFIEMDGDKAVITPRGVAAWEYGKGGYRMVLNYHIATSLAEFDMKVDAFGHEPRPDEKGLKWQLRFTSGETAIVDPVSKTPRGEEFMQRMVKAQEFAMNWTGKVNDPEAMKPAERADLSKLIRVNDKTFWASKSQRADIIQRVRNTFQPSDSGKLAFNLNLQPPIVTLPLLRESEGRTSVYFDATLRYFDDSGAMTRYLASGRLVVSADNSAAANSASAWRVDALEIESGRTPTERRRPDNPNAAGSP